MAGGSWTHGLTRNIVLLGVASLLTDVSSEMLVPLLPLFVALLPGVTPATLFLVLGIIEAFPEGVVTLVKLASGTLSDRLGKRKVFVALGYGSPRWLKRVSPSPPVGPMCSRSVSATAQGRGRGTRLATP